MNDSSKFKELLADQHVWPCEFAFKFIFKATEQEKFRAFFPNEKIEIKFSKEGKYVSATLTMLMQNPEEVLAVYEQAQIIEGIISL